MEWRNSQSTELPKGIDTTSSKVYNYVRRNIEEATAEGTEGDEIPVYNYEELKIEKASWPLYLQIEQAQADIDYLNMITEE